MKDEVLISAIAAGDESAMALCMRKYARLLWPVACAVLKNVGSEQDAEECVADAFVYLWEHPDRFDPGRGTVKSLLCTVVRSRAIDRYRQLLRRNALPLEETAVAGSLGLQERLLQKETRVELRNALNSLGEPCREILIRRYDYDQKPRQIALAMGLTVKQVDNALYRAKQQLRKALGTGGKS